MYSEAIEKDHLTILFIYISIITTKWISITNQRRLDMHTCTMHTLKDISHEPIGYSYNTKSALIGFEGARHTFGWYSNNLLSDIYAFYSESR